MKAGDAIASAIDLYRAGREVEAAAVIGPCVDAMRARGFRYSDLLAAAQRIRPGFTADDWEDLMTCADEADARG